MKRYITGDGFCSGTLCLTVPYDIVQPIKKGEYILCVVSYVAVIMDADVQIKMETVLPVRIIPAADVDAGADADAGVDAELHGAVIPVTADAETVSAQTAVLNPAIPEIPVPADAQGLRSMTESAAHIGRVTVMDGETATGRAGMMRPGTGTNEKGITVY